METAGSRSIVTSSEEYKNSLYFPNSLDAMIKEYNNRFEDKNLELMKAIQCRHPASPHFLAIDHLTPLVTLYKLNKEYLSMECIITKRTLKNKEITTINDVLLEVLPLKDAFPELLKLLK